MVAPPTVSAAAPEFVTLNTLRAGNRRYTVQEEGNGRSLLEFTADLSQSVDISGIQFEERNGVRIPVGLDTATGITGLSANVYINTPALAICDDLTPNDNIDNVVCDTVGRVSATAQDVPVPRFHVSVRAIPGGYKVTRTN